MNELAPADLVSAFHTELELCKVRAGETLLIFTDPRYGHPEYVPAAFAAARMLGAETYVLHSQGDQGFDDKLVRAAWRNADMVLGMSNVPRGMGTWMYTDTSNDALKGGARVLMVQENFDALKRMLPNETLRRRGKLGAELLAEAKEIRITSKAGSDFTMRKDGRKAGYQCGIADEPGRWDHWPSGLVNCAPIEDSAEGVYVVETGDVLLGLRKFAQSRVTMTLEKGKIVKIEGGTDAYLLQSYLESHGDEGAFRFSHAGWGTDERADWGQLGMDSESKYGTVMVALGRNVFDTPSEGAGLGGKNDSVAHCDICCRDAALWLDGQLVVENEQFMLDELK